MANLVVTGDLCFLGSCFTDTLYNDNHDVTILNHSNNGYQKNLSHLKNKNTLYISNLEKIKSIICSKKFERIFHLATAPRSCNLKDLLRDIETNYKGMISVLELAKKDRAKVVFTSNSYIYRSKDNSSSLDKNSINDPTTSYNANRNVYKLYYRIWTPNFSS